MKFGQRIKETREKIAAKSAEARKLIEAAEKEDRSLNENEQAAFDAIEKEVRELDERAGQYARMAALEESKGDDADPATETRNLDQGLGLTEKEKRNYNILKAIRCQLPGSSERLDGLEKECHDELCKRSGKSAQGVFVPLDIQVPNAPERRDLNLTTGAGAVGTTTVSTFIGLLRSKLLLSQLGVVTMAGLVGDLSIPKQTAGATGYWIDSESEDVTESSQAVGQVGMKPKTCGTYSDLSRKFIKQSSFDAQSFVMNDLAAVMARTIEAASLAGDGSSNQPTGITHHPDATVVSLGANGAAPTWDAMVDMETAVAAANADIGSQYFITTAAGRGKMKKTFVTAAENERLWNKNEVNGYTAHASNLLPSNLTKGSGNNLSAAIQGVFSQLVLGMWGGMDLLVDPITGAKRGTVRVVVLQDVDVAIRNGEAFAVVKDMVTT